jgi:hypothetical protein
MTLEEFQGSLLLPVELNQAIIALTDDGRAVYTLHGLIEVFTEFFDRDEDAAHEWVSYNTLRAIPYMTNPPIVVIPNDDDVTEDDDIITIGTTEYVVVA